MFRAHPSSSQKCSEISVQHAIRGVVLLSHRGELRKFISVCFLHNGRRKGWRLVKQRHSVAIAAELVIRENEVVPPRICGGYRIYRHDITGSGVGEERVLIPGYSVANVKQVRSVSFLPVVVLAELEEIGENTRIVIFRKSEQTECVATVVRYR